MFKNLVSNVDFLFNISDSSFFILNSQFITFHLLTNGILILKHFLNNNPNTFIFKIQNSLFQSIQQDFTNSSSSKSLNFFQISDFKIEIILESVKFIQNIIGKKKKISKNNKKKI